MGNKVDARLISSVQVTEEPVTTADIPWTMDIAFVATAVLFGLMVGAVVRRLLTGKV